MIVVNGITFNENGEKYFYYKEWHIAEKTGNKEYAQTCAQMYKMLTIRHLNAKKKYAFPIPGLCDCYGYFSIDDRLKSYGLSWYVLDN